MGKRTKKKPLVSGRQKQKAEKRIKGLAKKGRLNKEAKARFIDYKNRKKSGHIDFANRVTEDWLDDREFVEENDAYEEMVPLDMVSQEDIQRSSLSRRNKRKISESSHSESENDDDEEVRHFKEELQNDEVELLPLKIDGALVRRVKKLDDIAVKDEAHLEALGGDVSDMEVDEEDQEKKEDEEEDLSKLDPVERLAREKALLAEAEQRIRNHMKALQLDPQAEINRLGDLIKITSGQRVHSAIREEAQLLATSCTTQVLIDIIPGYHIRKLTAEERSQKMKKETRKLVAFEENLLLHYSNFLKLLEKHARKLVKPKASQIHENTFTTRLGMLSAESLGRLLEKAAHFNYATNLITCFVGFATSAYEPLLKIVFTSLSGMFKSDVALKISLHGVQSISSLVSNKQSKVPPELLYTFLSLNIRDIDRRNTEDEKEALKAKRFKIHREKKSKSTKKFDKQLKKVEADLKEVEASERLSTKLKLSTEIMKHVFATYFRVLRKMPNTALISPVLAGLSKFAHLINVDFFDDLVSSFEGLIEQKRLKTTDSLLCVRTVCVILSGEGKALNIDPLKFYKALYSMLPAIPFQKNLEKQTEEVRLLCECLDFMLNQRKKLVPFPRVVAFIKRLLLLGFALPPKHAISILASVRTHFIAHPKLASYVDADDDLVTNGIFKPDFPDPDYCNAISTNFVGELNKYEKYPNPIVASYAKHIKANIPSTGAERLKPEWCTKRPADWLKDPAIKDIESPYWESIANFAKKKKTKLTSPVIVSILNEWVCI